MELTALAVVERLSDVDSQKKWHTIFRDELSTDSGSDFLIDWNAIIFFHAICSLCLQFCHLLFKVLFEHRNYFRRIMLLWIAKLDMD